MVDPRVDPTQFSLVPVDNLWILLAGILVFFMQAGFGVLEAGTVQAKNTSNILVKNLLDASVGAIVFFFFGYGFAFGEDSGQFIGSSKWAFAATAATIVSGCVAERTRFMAYLAYTIFLTGFVYPVVVHWTWSGAGWATDKGVHDFAGSGVVHMTGGLAGLIGSIFVGPRKGRFNSDGSINERDFQPSSTSFQALGVMILWMGWYGFNGGSTLSMSDANVYVANVVAVNTTLAPAASVVTVLIWDLAWSGGHVINLSHLLNCILAGLVSITAGCAVVNFWAAIVIGIIGAFVYLGSSRLLCLLKIDDPLDAAPVHFFCGMWGVFAVGLFAMDDLSGGFGGLFYSNTGDGEFFGYQIAFIIAIIAWVGVMSIFLFGLLKIFGVLRVDEETEALGLDLAHHTPNAAGRRSVVFTSTRDGTVLDMKHRAKGRNSSDDDSHSDASSV